MAVAVTANSDTTTKKNHVGQKAMWAVPFLVFLLMQGGIVNVHQLQRFHLAIPVQVPVVLTERQSWMVNATINTTTGGSTAGIPTGVPTQVSLINDTVTDTRPSADVPPSRPSRNVNISIVVELAGELGNHLFRLAHGYAIQRILWDNYGLASHFVMQHQTIKKWVKPVRDLQDCFPHFRSMDFTLGNSAEFRQRLHQQQQWLGEANTSNLVFTRSAQVHRRLNYLMEILANSTPPTIDATANISLPFIIARGGANLECVDTYFEGLKRFFAFDEMACCKALPEPDEHVFHYRNFRTELRRVGKKLGFEEVSPNQSVGLLQGATKVAITTRFDNKYARAYLDAFKLQGWEARIVSGQTGMQDFCFLKHANNLLAGKRSTYAVWASLLGDARNVTLYKINTTHTRKKLGEKYASVDHHFNASELRDRIRFITLTP